MHIGQHMWKRGLVELHALEIDPVTWLEAWHHRITKGHAVAFDSHAILGWDFESDGVVCTSFQAAESFESPGVGKAVTKALRKHIPLLMEQQGVRMICTYSLCVDDEAPKWFRLLGLLEDDTYVGIKRGPYITRRFIRRA